MNPLSPLPALPAMSGITAANPSGAIGSSAAIGGADATSASASGGQSFVDALGDALGRLNSQLSSADTSMAGFAAGQSADIGSVMLQMQEASLGLQLGVQVRDRLLDAYNSVMRLSV